MNKGKTSHRKTTGANLNVDYIERLWRLFRSQPDAVSPPWRDYFQRVTDRDVDRDGRAASGVQPSFAPQSIFDPAGAGGPSKNGAPPRAIDAEKQQQVAGLIESYRKWGRRAAALDPLERGRLEVQELSLEFHGLHQDDLRRQFAASDLPGPRMRRLDDVVEHLQRVYCGTIGWQYLHLEDADARRWLMQQIENPSQDGLAADGDLQLRILHRLTAADVFEQFVRKKYVGAKTFSLAGAESLIPLLDIAIEQAAESGVLEIVLGMTHRGRLNVLANILGKRPQEIFREFDDNDAQRRRGKGDVRYHLGYSSDCQTARGDRMHVSLCFNPSHLEFVNPVALGRTRAKQQRAHDRKRRHAMAVLIHGDAGFAGEGIVQESLNLARLDDYTIGGALHIVVNNQLGFTTPPEQARSTTYSTDIARGLSTPIFHVHGEDLEAVVRVTRLALEYRRRFQRDVVIDLYGYRRWGHNEMDEPSFTQPDMYRRIENRPDVRELYVRRLVDAGLVTREHADRLQEEQQTRLEVEFEAADNSRASVRSQSLGGIWTGFQGGLEPADDDPQTAVEQEVLHDLLRGLVDVPDGFQLHRKLEQGLKQRREMLDGERPLDWSTAEALALASLLVEGRPVRLSGQDTVRGTFSQRHAVWHDAENGETHMPLAHLADDQAPVEIVNSPLCEAGAMGYEYGFSLDYPEALVAWEAQFGDFWNAAQVIFDQFIASAEDKWSRLSGLVLMLPHGFEGQGPEHSSARLERLLLSCAEHNLQVTVPSTPAQLFHCLRRQVLRRWRKPLAMLTPKSLLRHRLVVSNLDDLSTGRFQRVLPDDPQRAADANRLLLCCGKVYYDLLKAREQRRREDVAIARVEQLYPFPSVQIQQLLEPLSDAAAVYWVQEEPANMGAWQFLKLRWEEVESQKPLNRISRPASASPAGGSHAAHKIEQREIIDRSFGN
ncbi:MAG: 2-oxoglutarate dehydrogenase E1 component [Pirellulaceae bacterium]